MPRAINQRFGFACGLSATPAMTWAHRHDDVEVTLTLGGQAIMEHGGRRYQLADGACVIFWAGIPHQLVASEPGVSVRWLTVPLIDVLAWQRTERLAAELLRGVALTPVTPPTLTKQMVTWAAEIGRDSALTEAAQYEVRALFLRIGRHERAARARPAELPAVGTDRTAAAIAAFIATHFREPLQLVDIAEAVTLHPSTVGAVFRRSTGVTPGQYLAQCRIAEAQRLLIATDRTTIDIARRCGFGSTSRFYSAFAEHCQMAPATYRRVMRRRSPQALLDTAGRQPTLPEPLQPEEGDEQWQDRDEAADDHEEPQLGSLVDGAVPGVEP